MNRLNNYFNSAKIELICGGMFSGKTEELIRRLKRAKIAKLNTIIFKPVIDTRYDKDHITTHDKIKLESNSISHSDEMINLSYEADVVGIDEAQFFDDSIVQNCRQLAKIGKRVIIAGLSNDFRGNPFGPMPSLMCEADYIKKLMAICVKCGDDANFSQRVSSNSEQIMLGASTTYEAKCRSCFFKNK